MRVSMGVQALIWVVVVWPAAVGFGQTVGGTPGTDGSAGTTYVPHMVFDVASIRESPARRMSSINDSGSTSVYQAEGVSVSTLILDAYELDLESLLKNVPDWAKSIQYDVEAKSDQSTDQALAKLSESAFDREKHHMVRALLADRFKLQIHSEIRPSTVYELIATKRAAKLMVPVQADLSQTIGSCGPHFSEHGAEIESKGCPISILLGELHQALEATVVDHTNLSGTYAYQLRVGPSPLLERAGRDYYPPIVDAIREQLGLAGPEDAGDGNVLGGGSNRAP